MKYLKKLFTFSCILGSICLLGLLLWYPWLAGKVWAPMYDLLTQQKPIYTEAEFTEKFDALETIPFDSVMKLAYGPAQRLDTPKHIRRYRNRDFLLVKGFQRYQYLVAHHRLDAFLTPHRIRGRRLPAKGSEQVFLIRKKVLLRLLALHQEMQKEGLDDTEIFVTSAFRPPAYNDLVGGKSLSRHLSADALDIIVKDVDRDGDADEEDLQAVFKLLEHRVIGSRGGLGRYKSNRQLIHFDTRGRRARWHY